ncbi:MAG: hypothetical protein D6681_11140 [Calditrichaeota bacterium]|nr:MAG: hypothetical protein D6681_11140 [Calditrichota bacterium]
MKNNSFFADKDFFFRQFVWFGILFISCVITALILVIILSVAEIEAVTAINISIAVSSLLFIGVGILLHLRKYPRFPSRYFRYLKFSTVLTLLKKIPRIAVQREIKEREYKIDPRDKIRKEYEDRLKNTYKDLETEVHNIITTIKKHEKHEEYIQDRSPSLLSSFLSYLSEEKTDNLASDVSQLIMVHVFANLMEMETEKLENIFFKENKSQVESEVWEHLLAAWEEYYRSTLQKKLENHIQQARKRTS